MKFAKILFSASFFLLTIPSFSKTNQHALKLPAIFSDNMVLQRDIKIPVWGWANPDEKITVRLGKQIVVTHADQDGKWMVRLNPMEAGGPFTLTIGGNQNKIDFQNVLVGEVWLCSGQSNMEMPVAGNWAHVNNYQQETMAANYPNIRLITIPHAIRSTPQDDVSTNGWVPCTPDNIVNFSAAAYFFGRNLYQKLNVPIGLIHSSYGGTVAEAWTSKEALMTLPDFQTRFLSENTVEQSKKQYDEQTAQWYQSIYDKDTGYFHEGHHWSDPSVDISNWKTMQLPVAWQTAGLPDLHGVIWFHKDIDLPDSWSGRDLTLHLGPVDDMDITWFNGVQVGSIFQWDAPRHYKVPGTLVKSGKNTIVVRVLDTGGMGGIDGEPVQMKLEPADSTDRSSVSLAGDWKYEIGMNLNIMPPLPVDPSSPNEVCRLYNGMIHPLIPFAMRGVIWYQGESNGDRGYQYRKLFPTMITDWRNRWGQGDFPFLFVQLANWQDVKPEPGDDNWAELREAQFMTLSLPNTGMAVAIDIGEADNIHPKNKQEVGNRLALAARAIAYGEKIEYSGPLYQSMQIESNKIRIHFSHTNSVLVTKNGAEPTGFAIAGQDKKFVWANAKIEGDTMTIWSDKIPNPVAVRYGWAINPVCNLYNKVGLPASPFRTDSWPGITEKNK